MAKSSFKISNILAQILLRSMLITLSNLLLKTSLIHGMLPLPCRDLSYVHPLFTAPFTPDDTSWVSSFPSETKANSVTFRTWGNAVPGQFQEGVFSSTPRPAALLDSDGTFFTKDAPTYAGYAHDQFVNVKSVPGFPVFGDGGTDDSANLNAILAQAAAACKIV